MHWLKSSQKFTLATPKNIEDLGVQYSTISRP